MGESVTERNYIQDCSVTNSNFRGYVVHGTNNTRLSRNVAYNVKGMCFYLEDGVEERNTLEYNLAAHVHPIKKPADGGYGQGQCDAACCVDMVLPYASFSHVTCVYVHATCLKLQTSTCVCVCIGGEQFTTASDLIIPADTSASGFYIPNSYNSFIGELHGHVIC